MNKIKTRSDFSKKFPNIYKHLCDNKKLYLFQIVFGDPAHKRNGFWNFENCLKECKKFKSLGDWRNKSGSSYVIAKNNGWIKQFRKLGVLKCEGRKFWTKKECATFALKYNTKENWKKGHRKSWEKALNKGWQEELCAHMPKNSCIKKVKNLETGTIYNSISEAGKAIGQQKGTNISAVIRGRAKSAGGYHWAYCDEKGNVIK